MKITFLGVGTAFSLKNANSNLLVESGNTKLCIDCGRSAFPSIEKYGFSLKDTTHILLSAIYSDKTGGLEEVAFMTKFVFKFKVALLGTPTLLDRLWHFTLKGGLEYIEEFPGDLTPHRLEDYYNVLEVTPQQWHTIDEESLLKVYLHPTQHIKGVETYAIEVREGLDDTNKRFLFSGNTKYDLDFIEQRAKECSYIFHDCQLNKEAYKQPGQHASYQQLVQMPPEIKKKVWLYHYEDEPLPNAQEDGFAGFAKDLQSFTL